MAEVVLDRGYLDMPSSLASKKNSDIIWILEQKGI